MDVECSTHYFFWGSYTSSLSQSRSSNVIFPDMSQGLVCPVDTIRFTDIETVKKAICAYSWPTEAHAIQKVCYIERAEMISFAGVTTVDGHPIGGCQGSTCTISPSERFYHSNMSPPRDTELTVHYEAPASCNENLCAVAGLQEAYPILEVVTKVNDTIKQYKSISGSIVTIDRGEGHKTYVEPGTPIADATLLSKIVALEVNAQELKEEISHICRSIKHLYQSVTSLTQTSPTAAASLYLNRTDIQAQFISVIYWCGLAS